MVTMPTATPDRHPKDRPAGETRTPVQIDADIYDEIRRLALADDRTIARYVNRVLKAHCENARNYIGGEHG